jgi:hypothetical protein
MVKKTRKILISSRLSSEQSRDVVPSAIRYKVQTMCSILFVLPKRCKVLDLQGLTFEPQGLYCERPRPSLAPVRATKAFYCNFDFNVDPDLDPDTDLTSNNNVDPCGTRPGFATLLNCIHFNLITGFMAMPPVPLHPH